MDEVSHELLFPHDLGAVSAGRPLVSRGSRPPRAGARFRSGTLLEWNSAVLGSGSGARYDVMRGTLAQLPPGPGSGETCLANDASGTTLTDAAAPAVGTGFYYLVRTSNACGTGTFGEGSSGSPRSTGVCP